LPHPALQAAGDPAHWLALLSAPDEKLRLEATTHLGRGKSARALAALSGILADDPSAEVRAAAARALAIIGDPRAKLALELAAEDDPEAEVRGAAQFALEVIEYR
jgi:HEAT repeat protein